jgi:hypothetical protein
MTNRENILQELNELKSTLATVTPQNVYAVPEEYFDNLATQVLNRIKALEANNAAEELVHLSPVIKKISKEIPFSVPRGYFETLAENTLQTIREGNDHQTAKEELETLSPLLNRLNKKMPYTVPQGYFESIGKKGKVPVAKVISITHRRWFKYVAAAVVTGFFVLAGFVYLNTRKAVDPVEQPYAWVKKNINKVDTADINAFVNLADEELLNQASLANNPAKPVEITELMKDVSDKEIQEFLDATPDVGSDMEPMMN